MREKGLTAQDLFTAAGVDASAPTTQAAPVATIERPADVRLEGRKIVIGPLPYDGQRVAAVRTIPGRKWVGSKKVDEVPFNAASAVRAVEVAEQFGLVVDPALIEAAAEAAAEAAHLLDASRHTDADVDVDLAGDYSLYPFQRAATAYALRVGRGIIGLEMGLGKTPVAQAATEAREAFPAVVVAPAVMKWVWADEIAKFFPHRTVTVLSGRTAEAIEPADYIVVNYDILPARLDDILALSPQALILDEAQYIKNKGTKRKPVQRTKAAQALAKAIPDDGLVLLLTGTPITNRPLELVTQLEALGHLKHFGGFTGFTQRYCDATFDGFGWDFSGASNLEELNDRLRSLCYFRVTKADVLPELPPVQHSVQHIDTDPKVMKAYRLAESGLVETASGGYERLDSEGRAEVLRQITALRVLAARAKIGSTGAWVENFLDSSEGKVIIFGHHREIVDALAERFDAPRIQGGQPEAERMAAMKQFQEDPDTRVIVASITAAGVGLTLTAAHDVVFVEGAWTPAAIDQAVARAYGRMDDLHGVNAWHLRGHDAYIDDDMGAMVDGKRAVVDAVTDGRAADDESSGIAEVLARMAARAA